MTQTTLLLGHDIETTGLLNEIFSDAHYTTDVLSDGKTALKLLSDMSYTLIVMQYPLQDMDAVRFISKLRHNGIHTPLVVLTKDDDNDTVIKVLQAGADLCLTHPLAPAVLKSRIHALIRRAQWRIHTQADVETKLGPFKYNTSTLELFKKNRLIPLTSKENALIKNFFDNPNVVFSVEKLYSLIWHSAKTDSNSIMVYINRLRQKIEDDPRHPVYIRNIRGKGYTFCI